MTFAHLSVMTAEVLRFLGPEPQRRYLDGTLGGGGHAEAILTQSNPDSRILGLDRDDEAVAAARARLDRFGDRVVIRRASFTEAKEILSELDWNMVDGVLLDLGVSSRQFDSAERGFSFRARGPLDMRMDRRQSLDAAQLVNETPAVELERIFREYGEEPQARRIAAAIVAARAAGAIEDTQRLAAIVAGAKRPARRDRHPATRVFQALRIAVNGELAQLQSFLDTGYELLKPKGRMVIISFHSLEDRLVKNAFKKWDCSCLCPPRAPRCNCGWSRKAKLLTRRPLVPSADEVESNPRARSAKLRAVERLAA